MALVKCVECKRQVSTLADACPHCGAPLHHSDAADDSDESSRDTSGCMMKAFLIIVVLGLVYLLGKKHIDPVIIKLKDKYFKQSEGSGRDDGGTPSGPRNILHPKSPDGSDAPGDNDDPDPNAEPPNLIRPKPEPADETINIPTPPSDKPTEADEPKDKVEPTTVKEPSEAKDTPDAEVPKKTDELTDKPPAPEDVKKPDTESTDPAPDAGKTPVAPQGNTLIDKVSRLKLKIVASLTKKADGKLIVTVNENWPMLSKEQKQEAAAAVHDLWIEEGGTTIEFQNNKGDKVATPNQSSKLIHGKMRFIILDPQ